MNENDIKIITSLIDNYGVLLSAKKKMYIENYYFNDLSLQEIALANGVSRAAVHQSITDGIKELEDYENKLKYIEKQNRRSQFYKEKIKDINLLNELMDLEYDK
ncbi:MAG: sigma factor-like helix-turn-helix DNA-binding protein [Mycoplasma sp.]